MSEIIPFEKDIKFDTKISEITSISLEHEEEYNQNDIEGKFIVSGDYKVHPISVNKESFKYEIPFNIELSDSINKESIKLNINDFTYDIKDSDTLNLKIEIDLNYELKEIERELEEFLDKEEIEETIQEEKKEEQETKADIKEKEKKEEQETKVDIKEEVKKESDNSYVTYHVYMITKEDTIDSICLKYNVDKDILHEYNNFDELNVGDKLLIPIKDE